MKKLFILIFTLTLSTNAFSWGSMSCDGFLDVRKVNDKDLSAAIAATNTAAFNFFIFGMMDGAPKSRELLNPLVINFPVSTNQMLYLIEKECRKTPTQSVFVIALEEYRKIIINELKKKK